MKWKAWVVDYLTFTKRERFGVLILICLIFLIFLLPQFVSQNKSTRSITADTAWITAAKKLEVRKLENEDRKSSTSPSGNQDYAYQYDRSVTPSPSGNLFYFDPNTLNATGWEKLGLKNKTIKIIKNYLSKGGHFYKPEDLKRIYGLHPNDYARLETYIKIETRDVVSKTPSIDYPKKENENRRVANNIIDVNIADTSAFISLPGIGSKLAARIVNFRDKLGGFYSINQVGEVYGLQDSTFQQIKQFLMLENISVKKININAATIDELKNHPYFKYPIANPIIAYRNEHGPFSKVEDVKKVMAVGDEIYSKIVPYITTQ